MTFFSEDENVFVTVGKPITQHPHTFTRVLTKRDENVTGLYRFLVIYSGF
jgi:hypothetical protein